MLSDHGSVVELELATTVSAVECDIRLSVEFTSHFKLLKYYCNKLRTRVRFPVVAFRGFARDKRKTSSHYFTMAY